MEQKLILPQGGYRKLKSFQVSQLVYDVTIRFCDSYISKRSRTHDQMVQAARSGVQNIAEGSAVAGTSKKMELKLTNVARASLEELRLDYEDFLRHRKLSLWPQADIRREQLFQMRPTSANDVSTWASQVHSPGTCYAEIVANGALLLIVVAASLLDRQLRALAAGFTENGGFSERLYLRRRTRR